MKKALENRNFGFWLGLAAALIALVGSVLYIALDGSDKTFSLIGFILALVGVAFTALGVFTRVKFAPLLPTLLYSAAFGFVLRVAVPSLSDVWNKVNFIGGNATMGCVFAGVYLLSAILGCVSCFTGISKE